MPVGEIVANALEYERDLEHWKAVAEARSKRISHLTRAYFALQNRVKNALISDEDDLNISLSLSPNDGLCLSCHQLLPGVPRRKQP